MSTEHNILAGRLIDLQYNAEAKEFKPAGAEGTAGPIITVRTLDYFTANDLLAEKDDAERIRKGLALFVVKVDGDEEKAAAFIANPAPRYAPPLYLAAWSETWGN